MSECTYNIHHLARVEGHGTICVDVKNKKLEKVELQVPEGARMFEAWLPGRPHDEITHLVCRICAICSGGHTAASLKALEDALKIAPSPQTVYLRDLMTMGEFIQSHALHAYMLALPDFLGFDSVISMASKYPEEVKAALKIKKLGNDIAEVVAGRAVHQISAKINGFTRIPKKSELDGLLKRLKELRPAVVKTEEIFAKLKYPELQRKTEYIALKDKKEYALYDGEIVSSEGWKEPVQNWEKVITEKTVPHSNSRQGWRNGKGFLTGPLARMNLNFDQLSDTAKKTAKASGIKFPNYNPFISNYARIIELIHCFDKTIKMLEEPKIALEDSSYEVKAGEGWGATEVPRGTLYHSYAIDEKGICTKANIITPTAQNLRNIEEDMEIFVPTILDKPKQEVELLLEMLVRAYDPCISCATHFLEVKYV